MRFQVGSENSVGVQIGRSELSASEALERAAQLENGSPAEVFFVDVDTGQRVTRAEVKRLAKEEKR